MGSKLLIIDAQSILRLLTHYTDGMVPLDTEAVGFGVSPFIQRWIGIETRSAQWPEEDAVKHGDSDDVGYYPLHIRYDGNHIIKWHNRDTNPTLEYDFEKPKNQQ